jgi:hypothetical protein
MSDKSPAEVKAVRIDPATIRWHALYVLAVFVGGFLLQLLAMVIVGGG